MKTIPVEGTDRVIMCDDEDYDRLGEVEWRVKDRNGRLVPASCCMNMTRPSRYVLVGHTPI